MTKSTDHPIPRWVNYPITQSPNHSIVKSPLSRRFVKKNPGRGCGVNGIGARAQGNRHMLSGFAGDFLRKPRPFTPNQHRNRATQVRFG